MERPKSRKELAAEFWDVVLDPYFLLAVVTTLAFVVGAVSATDTTLKAVLTLFSSVFGGITGRRASQRWLELHTSTAIQERAKISIRGLKVLLGSLVTLGDRARRHLTAGPEHGQSQENSALVQQRLEELSTLAAQSAENVIAAIENWTDVLPQPDLRSEIGVFTEMTNKVNTLAALAERTANELSESRASGSKETEQLTAQLKEARESEAAAKMELEEKKRHLANQGVSVVSASVRDTTSPFVFTAASSLIPRNLRVTTSLPPISGPEPTTVTIADDAMKKER